LLLIEFKVQKGPIIGGILAVVGKKEYKIVGLTILFLLCWIGLSPLACRSTEVWSDDFNDGDYVGWTICDNLAISDNSDWTAADHYLELNQTDWGAISHPSDVAYGTWSFDFKANDTLVDSETFASIEFISNNIHDLDDFDDWICYWIYFDAISTTDGLKFDIKLRKNVWTILDTSETPVPVTGWHHIEVTRDMSGLFSVYHNGSLVIQLGDTEITTSELFVFSPVDGAMFDNIVVDDAPPATINWMLIGAGVSVVVIILVLVIILKRR